MKLSEAIELGSTLMRARTGTYFDLADNSGCALGMAMRAEGVPIECFSQSAVHQLWPWTAYRANMCLLSGQIMWRFDHWKLFERPFNEFIAWVRALEAQYDDSDNKPELEPVFNKPELEMVAA